jgi:2-amino-4-hydroxy-6-hydroxymethyldihydropteridine diphosphokinase
MAGSGITGRLRVDEMPIVYLGIGSNIGKREDNCLRAISLLRENGLKITKRSGMHETEPWGVKDQPRFINMAVEAETDVSPRDLLLLLKKTERDMGRLPGKKWGPRVIDIDLLMYDNLQMNEAGLTVPHPLMHEREFVLLPLSEIAPEKVHPVLHKTIRALLDRKTFAREDRSDSR